MDLFLDVNGRENRKRIALKKGITNKLKVYLLEEGKTYDYSKVRTIELKINSNTGNHVFRKLATPDTKDYIKMIFTPNDLSTIGESVAEFIIRDDYDCLTTETFILEVEDNDLEVEDSRNLERIEFTKQIFLYPCDFALIDDKDERYLKIATIHLDENFKILQPKEKELYSIVDTFKRNDSEVLTQLNTTTFSDDTFNTFKKNTQLANKQEVNLYFQGSQPTEYNGFYIKNYLPVKFNMKDVDVIYVPTLPTTFETDNIVPIRVSDYNDPYHDSIYFNFYINNSNVWSKLVDHYIKKNGTKYSEKIEYVDNKGIIQDDYRDVNDMSVLEKECFAYGYTYDSVKRYGLLEFYSRSLDRVYFGLCYELGGLGDGVNNTYYIRAYNYKDLLFFDKSKQFYLRSISNNITALFYVQDRGLTNNVYLSNLINPTTWNTGKTLGCFVIKVNDYTGAYLNHSEREYEISKMITNGINSILPNNLTSLSIDSITETGDKLYLVLTTNVGKYMIEADIKTGSVRNIEVAPIILQSFLLPYENYVSMSKKWYACDGKYVYDLDPATGEADLIKKLPFTDTSHVVYFAEYIYSIQDETKKLRIVLDNGYFVDIFTDKMKSVKPKLYIEYDRTNVKYWTELIAPSIKTINVMENTYVDNMHNLFKTGFNKALLVLQDRYPYPETNTETYYYGDGNYWREINNS